MPSDNPAKITIKRRERDAVLEALQAGLVPRQGLHLIQVGRKAEISALISDLDRIAEGGAAFRLVAGRFGSGKTFFLSLRRETHTPTSTPQAAEMLAAARAVFESTGLAVQNFIATRNSTVWFPWAGTRTHEALNVLAALDHIRVRKDLISLTYDNCPQDRFKEHCGMVASGELTFGDLSHGGIQMERDRFDQYVPSQVSLK